MKSRLYSDEYESICWRQVHGLVQTVVI